MTRLEDVASKLPSDRQQSIEDRSRVLIEEEHRRRQLPTPPFAMAKPGTTFRDWDEPTWYPSLNGGRHLSAPAFRPNTGERCGWHHLIGEIRLRKDGRFDWWRLPLKDEIGRYTGPKNWTSEARQGVAKTMDEAKTMIEMGFAPVNGVPPLLDASEARKDV